MAIDTYKCPPSQRPDSRCMEVYTVKAGDTLYAISQAYGVSVGDLMQTNRILNPYNLKVGQKICIPHTAVTLPIETGPEPLPTPALPACDSGITHTIVKGDTLYMIAKQYGVTLDALMAANPTLDPYNLKVGDSLCIPGAPVNGGNGSVGNGGSNGNGSMPMQPTTPSRPTMPECYGGRAYTTQRGDTLARILERFGLTYGQLLAANPDVDFTGSLETLTLCIPITGDDDCIDTYTVVRGDTLDSISQRFLMISDMLLMANPDLTCMDFSKPGTEICIPR